MYYKKYLKYKQKYADLKKNFINQVGGNRKILFTFNNDYLRVYAFDIQAPDDDFDTFKNRILYNPDDKNIEIFDRTGIISNNESFSKLPSFTILNVCTSPENIKQDILKCMIFNLPEPDLDGEATPMRRTKSVELVEKLSLLHKKKPLNLYLYDVKYSQIKFYKNNKFLKCNWQNADIPNNPDIEVLFDSGNGCKTLIPRSIAQDLQCEISLTTPNRNFIHFCNTTIRRLFTQFGFDDIHQFLLGSGALDSRTIYDTSRPFLDVLIQQNYDGFYYEFIEKLNLVITGGVNRRGIVAGFEQTTFQFLINGTENNFKNRKGIIIPLTVSAYITDELEEILINDKTIETLEYYRLFLNVDHQHETCHVYKTKMGRNKSRLEAILRRLSEKKPGEPDLNQQIKDRQQQIRDLELEKLPVKDMKCINHFYKIDIKKTSILLLNKTNQYVRPVGDYKVVFDTGNSATTLISPEFIRRNPNINFNPVLVMPYEPFYEVLEKLIAKYHDDVQLIQVLSRWRNKQLTSAQIYAEFMGSTSKEFQENYKNIFIGHLNLIMGSDVSKAIQVKGGTKYKFRLGIENFPDNIEINAISTDFIMPINIFLGNRAQPSPAPPFDILISVDETKKLNDLSCFIGNIQQKKESDTEIANLRKSINELLAVRATILDDVDQDQLDLIHEQIQTMEIQINQFDELKYGAEIVPCINDQFFIKKFYEDVIIIAHRKFEFILRTFQNSILPISRKFDTELKHSFSELIRIYAEQIKAADTFAQKIMVRSKSEIDQISIDDLQKILMFIPGKKCRFLAALQKAVDTANQIRMKVLPTTQEYKINDNYR
jgi:hypothetical protein